MAKNPAIGKILKRQGEKDQELKQNWASMIDKQSISGTQYPNKSIQKTFPNISLIFATKYFEQIGSSQQLLLESLFIFFVAYLPKNFWFFIRIFPTRFVGLDFLGRSLRRKAKEIYTRTILKNCFWRYPHQIVFNIWLFVFQTIFLEKLWGDMASTFSSGGISLANLSLKTLGVISPKTPRLY